MGRSPPAAQQVMVTVPHTTPKHARMIIARQGMELMLRFVSKTEILHKTSHDTEHRDRLCLVAPTFPRSGPERKSVDNFDLKKAS